MKKLLFAFPIVALLAAGCNSAAQPTSQSSLLANQNSQSAATQTNNAASLNQAPKSCDNLISLDQIKSSVADSDTVLSTSSSNPAGDNSTAVVSCMYANYSLSNPQSMKNTVIQVSLSVFNFSQENWDLLKSNNGFNPMVVSGLGSQAVKYFTDKTLQNAAYLVTSSNGKYIIVVWASSSIHPSGLSQIDNVTFNTVQEAQAGFDIAKTVNANLNSY